MDGLSHLSFVVKRHQVKFGLQTFTLKNDKGTEIAAYLEKLIQEMAGKGWEFYRIDTVGVLVPPGCLAAFAGMRATMTYYNIVAFRRPA